MTITAELLYPRALHEQTVRDVRDVLVQSAGLAPEYARSLLPSYEEVLHAVIEQYIAEFDVENQRVLAHFLRTKAGKQLGRSLGAYVHNLSEYYNTTLQQRAARS